MSKTIKEFYLNNADGTITYEYSDDTTRSFNLDEVIQTGNTGEQTHTKLQFLTDLADPLHSEGLLFYDKNDHCLAYFNDDSNVKVSLSREQMVRVFNNKATAIADGLACHVDGAIGGWPTVELTIASSRVHTESTLGVCTGRIEPMDYGYICVSGNVNGIDTSAYVPGTILYISSTTPGVLTSTPAVQPNFNVEVATVLTQSSTVGSLLVRVDKKSWLPSLELVDNTASMLVPLTPTILKPSTTSYNDGFEYNSSTGEITIGESKTYTINMQFNFRNGNSNKIVYFYIEELIDSVWTPVKYSARMMQLSNVDNLQYLLSYSKYYKKNMKIRLYYWSNNSTVYIETSDLPGTPVGTLVLPAFKLNMA